MKTSRYLKKPTKVIKKRRRDEKRLGALFLTMVAVLIVLLAYFLPKSAPSRSMLFSEGKNRLVENVRAYLQQQGYHELKGSAVAPGRVTLSYELPASEDKDLLAKKVNNYLKRQGFFVKKVDNIAKDAGFTIFVDFQTIPIGTLAFIRLDKPSAVRAPLLAIKPKLVIVIDDFGYSNQEVIRNFLRLPGKLTVSVIPGHPYSKWAAGNAKLAGKEVIIHMPMEPEEGNLKGGEDKYMLLTSMTPDEIKRRIEMAHAELPEAIGMNNHMGSLFTADPELMQVVITSLKAKGLYFIDSLTSPRSVAYEIATRNKIPAALRSVFLDNVRDKSEIQAQFEKAIEIARRSGRAVAIGHVYPETLAVLNDLLKSDLINEVELAFASEVTF
ncbi:MAG: divergent polysaccharide deacetylase family protein [Candidatus Marinimicrobia bacterium]|nr:divergent polysaccharide deacetylase family protein [Candidatus Neomarinimicrobiota bacterium]